MPTHLPFDVWVAVAAYLPVRSLLYLRSVRNYMSLRLLYSNAVIDL